MHRSAYRRQIDAPSLAVADEYFLPTGLWRTAALLGATLDRIATATAAYAGTSAAARSAPSVKKAATSSSSAIARAAPKE